jgi:hypothetical protein
MICCAKTTKYVFSAVKSGSVIVPGQRLKQNLGSFPFRVVAASSDRPRGVIANCKKPTLFLEKSMQKKLIALAIAGLSSTAFRPDQRHHPGSVRHWLPEL